MGPLLVGPDWARNKMAVTDRDMKDPAIKARLLVAVSGYSNNGPMGAQFLDGRPDRAFVGVNGNVEAGLAGKAADDFAAALTYNHLLQGR